LNFMHYTEEIDKVTSQDINNAAIKMLKTKPTLTFTGANVNTAPTLEQCMHALNSN